MAVDRIVPTQRPVEHRDTRLKGLVLRVTPGGSKSWYCEFARGKRVWLGRADVLGVTEARESARAILAVVFQGIDPIEARKPKAEMPTFGDYLDGDYADWAKSSQKAHAQNLNRLKTAFKALLKKSLDKITALDVERWRAKEVERGLSNQTINRDIASIKACFNRAVDWGILPANPLAKVRKARVDDCLKVRYLSEAEEARLRAAIEEREERRRAERDTANRWRAERGYVLLPSLRDSVFTDHVKPLILMSINTGCRRGELFDLTWSNVNLDRRILTVTGATAKSRRTRHIPLNREAMSVLLNWRAQSEDTSGLVFVNEQGERFDRANSSWRRLLKDAQIAEFRWHDMRHHFASRLAMGGVDLNTIRELLGHSDYTMTLRYAHLAPEFKLKAVEVLDEAREAALSGAKVLSIVR
ncbi:tyrosine-type recombinase/integrase [Novosphingobium sp.]|uniref:phage integrase n=1 Tax=Novosphingobium sp. TaxID=1874826 RepID=UPI0025F4C4D7|nr:tyrosine-type recombinase/integrase [Novosphingobium sp.]MCC6925708.1 tyrosine-type recombinase/integrase [Novosphingobium sp.]